MQIDLVYIKKKMRSFYNLHESYVCAILSNQDIDISSSLTGRTTQNS